MASPSLLAADLLMRIGVDASGVDTEIAAKLSRAERAAVASGDRIAAGVSRGADKATAAQLRVVAATERYNKVLKSGKATQGQIASAQASLITAQRSYQRELTQTEAASTRLAKAERSRGAAMKDQLRAAGLGIAAYKAAQTIRDSIDLSKEYQDAVDRNASALGRSAADITRFANTTAGAYNLSNLAAEKFVGDFALLFEKSGSSTEKATQQAIELTRRLADVRSFYGGTLEDAKTAFQSALVGENEPIRRYGVLLDEARLKQIAFSQGLVKDTTATLPPAVKAQAAYAAILQQTTKAQGDVARTSDSAANSAEDAREKFERAKVTLGTGLLPAYTSLAQVSAELAPTLALVGRGIGAVFGNDTSRRTVLAAAGIAGALITTNKAVKLYGEISENVFRRTAGKVAANASVARSYDAVAASATRAASAETAAGRAGFLSTLGGAGAGRYGLAGVLAAAGFAAHQGINPRTENTGQRLAGGLEAIFSGRFGDVDRSASNAFAIGKGFVGNPTGTIAQTVKALFGGDDPKRKGRELVTVIDQTTGAIKEMTKAEADAAAVQQAATDAAKRRREEFMRLRDSLGVDAFAAVAKQDNVSAAREALAQAIQARNDANSALADARSTSVGGDRASANDIRAAQLRLQAAQQRAREEGATPSERASVIAAQERLNDLRNKGKATVEQTKTAEGRVADAIRNQEEAQKRVNEARKALQQASGLGQGAVLGRLRGTVADRERFAKDVRDLSQSGIARPVLDQLLTLERDAPGTIRKIVRQGITPTFVKEMNEGLARLEQVETSLARSLTRASKSASRAAAEAAAEVYYPRFIGKLRELAENDPEGFPVPVFPSAPTRRGTASRLARQARDGGFPTP